MKKQGFTLIELMVVVVIIGILAAVAVPKLFGMIAKSKASEVGPAAGEYVKLQDAYVSEKGDTLGTWGGIGYRMQNSASFTYDSVLAVKTELKSEAADVWKATSNVKLNDCAKGNVWSLSAKSASKDASGATVAYTAKVNNAETDNDCSILTPQFYNLTTK